MRCWRQATIGPHPDTFEVAVSLLHEMTVSAGGAPAQIGQDSKLLHTKLYVLLHSYLQFYRRASNDNAGKTGFIGEASCFMSSRLLMLSSETDIFQSKTSCDIIARISFVATREPGHFRAP